MSEINTKIFKPQKWVLDVLNSPKGETIEFEIEGATESFIKISDKVPENIDERFYLYIFNEGEVIFQGDTFIEIDTSVYAAMNAFYIFTDNIEGEGISKGVYLSEETYELFKEIGVTEFYLIFQTNQDFSISKKTIEGDVHPIENKYIPDDNNKIDIILRHDYDAGYFLYNAMYNGSEIRQDDLFELLQTKDANIIIEYLDAIDITGTHFYIDPIYNTNQIIAFKFNQILKNDDLIVYSATGYIYDNSLDINTAICTLKIIPEFNSIYMSCNCLGTFHQI